LENTFNIIQSNCEEELSSEYHSESVVVQSPYLHTHADGTAVASNHFPPSYFVPAALAFELICLQRLGSKSSSVTSAQEVFTN